MKKIKKNKKIICVGSICKDIFFPTDEGKVLETPEDILAQEKIYFEMGAKYKIEERFESLGGCAANVAVGLSRLGIDAACYGAIGGDSLGEWIKKELEKNKVNTELVFENKKFSSDLSAIVVDKRSAERIIFSNQRVNGLLQIKEAKLKDFSWIFVGDLHGDWEDNLNRIIQVAEKYKLKIAYNPRQSNIHDNPHKVIQSIAFADVLFLNKDEAKELILALDKNAAEKDLADEVFLINKLREMGARVAVITDGRRGAWAKGEGVETYFLAGRVVPAVDSTGAGDAFSSGFLAAHLKEESLADAVRWGIANSASEVQCYGSIEGLLDEKQIQG